MKNQQQKPGLLPQLELNNRNATINKLQQALSALQTTINNNAQQSIDLQKVKCSQGNQCEMICISRTCLKKNPFICIQKGCKCRRQEHFGCANTVLEFLLNKIQSKKNQMYNQFSESVNQGIDKAIDQLSDFRQKINSLLQEQQPFFGLNLMEKYFVTAFQKHQTQELTGNAVSYLFEALDQPRFLRELQNKIQTELKVLKQSIMTILSTITNLNLKYVLPLHLPPPPPPPLLPPTFILPPPPPLYPPIIRPPLIPPIQHPLMQRPPPIDVLLAKVKNRNAGLRSGLFDDESDQ